MPLFSWMKWAHEGAECEQQDQGVVLKTPGVTGSRLLIGELLWHVEERERLAHNLEREHRLAHGALGFRCFQKYPWLRTLIPSSELRQLERLCAQILPVHTATVLSRFREVLATNNILPWELVYVFRQVLRDFLSKEECDEDQYSRQPAGRHPMETCTNPYQTKQGIATSTAPSCREHLREEIPTISGYVDRATRCSSPFMAHKDWDLPYYYAVPFRPTEGYSTAL